MIQKGGRKFAKIQLDWGNVKNHAGELRLDEIQIPQKKKKISISGRNSMKNLGSSYAILNALI